MKEISTIARPPVAARHAARPRRRVALFAGAYNHVVDGLTLTLNRLVGHLEDNGYDVLVFAPSNGEPALDHKGTLVDVPCFRIPFRKDYFVSMGLIGEARKRLDEFAPDLIHIATPDYLGLTALLYSRRRGIPSVSSYHTHFSTYLKYYRLQRLESLIWRYLRWTYGQNEHLYVPTQSMASVLRSHGIRDNIRIWSRGIDIDRFRPENRSLAWRHRLGISDDEVVVLFVSRLVWEKGLETLAATLHHLKARGVPHRAVVVGSGPAHDELKAMAPPEVMTLGHLEGDDLATAYASSDVFFFPSHTETFGNVTLEAMASGLPTVCADAPGSASIVRHQETGYLCPPEDPEAFSRVLEKLISDGQLRSGMGQAATAAAKAYDWDDVLERMVANFEEVLIRTGENVVAHRKLRHAVA